MYFVPVYILILLFTIIIDYVAGILLENADERKKKLFLVMSIIANVGILAFFKYFNFLASNINCLFGFIHSTQKIPILDIILPLGLSFHTFQAMSYTIEVYRGNQKAERHLGIYALYVMFYPQLVAGPIERPQNILHQFHEKKLIDYDSATGGMRLIMLGMYKKVVVADNFSIITTQIFDSYAQTSGICLAIGAIFFMFQVYCDFSGYSDIALGCAQVMGYKLMTNFNHPFISKSITEFWRRWHISLSSWFYDYLFSPLHFSIRKWGKAGVSLALLVTFFLSGLWHGPNWNYIIWGTIHGIIIIYEFLTKDFRTRIFRNVPLWLNNAISTFTTFSLLAFSVVFFRADSLKMAFQIVRRFLNIPQEILHVLVTRKIAFLGLPGLIFLGRCTVFFLVLEVIRRFSLKYDLKRNFNKLHWILRWAIYYGGVLAIFYLGVYEKHQFIYFQF